MEYKTHLHIAIFSDNKFQEDDYVAGIYKGIKTIDEDAQAVIGTPFHDRFISGIEYAGNLLEAYIKNKDSLSREDINRYLKQLGHMKEISLNKLPSSGHDVQEGDATKTP